MTVLLPAHGGNELAKYETVVAHVLSDVKFRIITFWNEAHSSVTNRVPLRSQEGEASHASLRNAGREFANVFGPLATLKMRAARNAGIRGEEAMRFSDDFKKAMASW